MTRPTIGKPNTLTSYSQWLCGIDENFNEKDYLDALTAPRADEGGQTTVGSTEVYRLDGIKVSSPQRGINILRTIGPDGKASVRRILVK